LPLLTAADRARLLALSRGPALTVPSDGGHPRSGPVHRRIEAQAASTPDAVAVMCGDERLTYGELDRRANRLARHLRGLGVGPEVLVALYLEKSIDAVTAVLAILKAGGAYVPLDPALPRERLAAMLADARPAALLTHERLRAGLAVTTVPVISLDGEAAWAS